MGGGGGLLSLAAGTGRYSIHTPMPQSGTVCAGFLGVAWRRMV